MNEPKNQPQPGVTPQSLRILLNEESSFMTYNGMALTELTETRATVTLTVGPNCRNIAGNVHGGALLTLADSAAGALARAAGNGRYVTLNGSLNFIKGVREGTLSAVASVLHPGRTTSVVTVDIRTETGALAAAGTFTFFRVGDWGDA